MSDMNKRLFTSEELDMYEEWYKSKISQIKGHDGKDEFDLGDLTFDRRSFYKEVVVAHRRNKKIEDLGI